MLKYFVNAQDPKDTIKNHLKSQEDVLHYCKRTLEWSLNTIIKDDVFDEILVSYQGNMVKSMIDDIVCKSKKLITTMPTNRYFCRLVDEMLFGKDERDANSCDLRKYLSDNDKIFVAHMDAYYHRDIYEHMIHFNRPIVAGVNDYVFFKINNSIYRWLADFMILASTEFLRYHNIKFSWNTLDDGIRNRFYEQSGGRNIFINNKPIEEVKSLDGLQDGSITLGILQNIGKIKPFDVIDIGNGNIKTPNCTHLKGFFSVETSNKFSTNNIILETVLFGKTDEQREKLKKTIDNQEHKYSILKKDITACYYSYFGQSVLNDQEKQNFYDLLKGILI